MVPRPRLEEQIAHGLHGPLTLITAPAGFGKTTLVASCIASFKMPIAWLSLDKGDNQVDRFLNYLVAALREADHTIGSEAAQLLLATSQVPPNIVLTSLVNDLDAADEEIVLVLDDYQFIVNQVVHDSVAFLLEHCPRGFHLVVATRVDPPIPVARLRARGQVVELRADHLRFTGPEAAQFLNDVMGLHLDAESVAALEDRTEGWIAGLHMAAISMRDRKDIPGFIVGFSGTNRFLLDYLVEEVLDSLPPHIQDFLLYTSILNRLTASLCDFILTIDELPELDYERSPDSVSLSSGQSASILHYLERVNLFLMPLDDERTWYRYHHLFADLLRARLHQAQPDLVSPLHIQAAAWQEQKGFIDEAIYHLLTVKEIDHALDLIEHYGPILLAEKDPSLLYMAESLPQDKILSRPKLGLYLAWLLIIQGRIAKALPLLNSLAQQPAITKPNSESQWMQTVVASALAFLAPPSSVPELDPLPDFQLFDKIPAGELILRNAAEFLYVMALGRRGELEHAAKVAVKCIEREKRLLGTRAIPTLAPFLTRIYLILGRLHEAASLCYEFLNPVTETNFQFLHSTGTMKIDLGEVLYEWNHLEEAEPYIRDGLQDNETWQNIMTDGFGLVALARILKAKGDYSRALRVVEKFETRLQEQSQPREFTEDLRTLRVRVQLASGDIKNSSRWADQIVLSENYKRDEEIYRLALARIRLAQGRYAEVEQLLTSTTLPLAAGSQVGRQLESDLLRAAAIARQGRMQEALILLDTCLAMAEPEGYIRVFLDVGEAARDLLTAYLRSVAPRHELFGQKLLDAFSLTSQVAPPDLQTGVLIEPLTEREIEVLELIALGMTNKEIAQQLIVAPGTVKAHTSSIYRKLNVTNRTEAAARAWEIGIFS